MKKTLLWLILLGLLTGGCTSAPEIIHANATGGVIEQLSELTVDPPGLVHDNTDLVSGSGNCAECHSGLQAEASACLSCHPDWDDDSINDISFDTLWRASMMAHSARDPYFQASVSAETSLFPERNGEIAEECARCHMPLAHFDATANHEPPLILEQGYLNPANELHDLAMDGVSCNLCHQIERQNFGQTESFSGHYVIDTEHRSFGKRVSYGPLPISPGYAELMQLAVGYRPVPSGHSDDSELCGTCHNLYTPYMDGTGEFIGEYPEQTVHLEWQNSIHAQDSCAECHMPLLENAKISSLSKDMQSYMRLHTFSGANSFMLNILKANAQQTGLTAEDIHMDGAIGRIHAQLTTDENTEIKLGDLFLRDETLLVELIVSNDNGHKRPTGFPSRRMWIHFWMTDADGVVFFESGRVDQQGFIQGNDNDLDPALYEPHYQMIDSPDQVQIYEAILHNTDNQVTTTLLRAAGYLKDNRLLPAGFPVNDPPPDIAPKGAALEDEDFVARKDTINYLIDLNGHPGPYQIQAELLYQTIGYRWAENLRQYGTTESVQFFQYYDQADLTPILLAATRAVFQ
ncbi:MAG: hypothetical protein JW757_10210 [Anaerolineales bacterium]|nr:hypothetical protein [Anaerolineales bacterium]